MIPTDDLPEIHLDFDAEETLKPWVEMWNSYDLDQVDTLFSNDPSLSYFSSEKEGAIIGLEAVREHHRGFGFVEGGRSTGNRLWLEDLLSGVHGSTAVVTGIWFFRRANGEEMKGPVTFVYSLGDRNPRLVHLNFGNYE